MYRLDPLGVRKSSAPSPLDYIYHGANFALESVNNLQTQIQEKVQEAERSILGTDANAITSATGGMSNASSEQGALQSDTTWQPRRVSGRQNGVSEKLMNSMASSKGELPMYKDKPYNYAPSRRNQPLYRRKRGLFALIALIVFFLWLNGLFPFSITSPATDKKRKSPGGLFGTLSPQGKHKWEARREAVRDAFKKSWHGYEQYGWGDDEYHPVARKGKKMVPHGMGWIIVDALDTLMIMNLTTELAHAREWISSTLDYDQDHDDINTFETTIRMLGGLLSAHYLSTTFPNMAPVPDIPNAGGEDMYLEKATDLAERLLAAFETPSGIPFASVNLGQRKGIRSHDVGGASSTAEAGTLQLEMKYLAKLTGEKHFWDHAENIIKVIDDNGVQDGLVPIFISPSTGKFTTKNIRLGSRGDSYYEYLIKQYMQTSKHEPIYQELWNEALRGVRKHLITYSKVSNLTILGERPGGLHEPILPKMDHLVCFMPGAIALGATGGLTVTDARRTGAWSQRQDSDIELARQLMKTCWGMYKFTATGLAPEITHFHLHDPPIMMEDTIPSSPDVLSDRTEAQWRQDYDIHLADAHNLQRPETVESLFYMWRITGDEMYREWGWSMFEAFMKHTAIPRESGEGFSSIQNVDAIPPPLRDNMESFWLAETLKYFYLLFGPEDLLPLDQAVFNTEAHPFPVFEPGKLFPTGWQRKPRDVNGNMVADPTAAPLDVEPPQQQPPEKEHEMPAELKQLLSEEGMQKARLKLEETLDQALKASEPRQQLASENKGGEHAAP